MSTTTTITHQMIDSQIAEIPSAAFTPNALVAAKVSRTARVLMVYRGLRPLLQALSVFPALPTTWRGAIQLFVTALDELAAVSGSTPQTAIDDTIDPFKAGKDLGQ
jgi:hypothetical protein